MKVVFRYSVIWGPASRLLVQRTARCWALSLTRRSADFYWSPGFYSCGHVIPPEPALKQQLHHFIPLLQTPQWFPTLFRSNSSQFSKPSFVRPLPISQASSPLTLLPCSTPRKPPFYLSSASTSCSPNSSVTLPSAWKDLPQGLPMLAHSYTLCFSSDGISSQSPPWPSIPSVT